MTGNETAGQPQGTLKPGEQEALEALRFSWGDAYKIWRDEEGCHARRRDGLGGIMTEDKPEALYNAVFDDYVFKPVPRDLPAEAVR
jgi:hypothetical protein